MHLTLTRLLTGVALAGSFAFVAACSGVSPSMNQTGPSALASSSTAGTSFSPNPGSVCDRPAPWVDSGDGSGTCVCPAPNIFDPEADTCTPPPPPPPPPGTDGCTPGYWKANAKKGAFNWPAPYSTATTLESVFDVPGTTFDNDTLLDALQYGGGDGVAGATQILLRAAAAALLNAQSSGVDYALTTGQVITQVNAALATGVRETILALATQLDGYNNGGCTLDNSAN